MKDFEACIAYTFRDNSLLKNALTHSSYANENREKGIPDNERLEFLGDSILGFVVAEHIYHLYPERPEGELTRIRAELVCEKSLARVARGIHLGDFLLLGNGEEQNGGRNRDSILSDAMESVFAAVYLDGGMDAARTLISRLLLQDTAEEQGNNTDHKTKFQELVQRKKNQTIRYHLVGESGPDHDKKFVVDVLLNDKVVGTGEGSSKKRAEQSAAQAAISRLFSKEK